MPPAWIEPAILRFFKMACYTARQYTENDELYFKALHNIGYESNQHVAKHVSNQLWLDVYVNLLSEICISLTYVDAIYNYFENFARIHQTIFNLIHIVSSIYCIHMQWLCKT